MKKNLWLFTILMLATISLIACGKEKTTGDNQESSQNKDEQAVDTASDKTTYPFEIEIYDEEGNTYTQTFEKAPERVILNNLSSIEMLLQLGLEDKIVGITNPDNKVTGEFAETVAGLNNLGDKMTISREVVLGQTPDVVVGRSLMFTDEYMGSVSTLNDLGVNVYTQSASIVTRNPKLTSVIDDVLTLGKIFDVNERAEEYAKELQSRYDAIVEKVNAKKGNEKLRLLAMVRYDSKEGTYFSFDVSQGLQRDLLTTLNLEPALEGRADNSNLETLISTNPDIILYINADRNAEYDEVAIESLLKEPLIQDVSAIKERRIFATTYDDFMDYGARIFDSLESLGNEIYGE